MQKIRKGGGIQKGEARLASIFGEDEGRNKWYTLAFGALYMYIRVLQSALKLLRSCSGKN
jgi:hypothetical protein